LMHLPLIELLAPPAPFFYFLTNSVSNLAADI
jgi:hypothetical protein